MKGSLVHETTRTKERYGALSIKLFSKKSTERKDRCLAIYFQSCHISPNNLHSPQVLPEHNETFFAQTHLAVTCDEGVYHIAREITMDLITDLKNSVLYLGTSHLTKVFFGCLWKYLRNDCAKSIYGKKTVSLDQCPFCA